MRNIANFFALSAIYTILLDSTAFFRLKCPGKVTPRRHLRIGFVTQSDALPEESTVGDVLAEAAAADHRDTQALVAKYLGVGGFEGRDQKVSSLSGGWKKPYIEPVGRQTAGRTRRNSAYRA